MKAKESGPVISSEEDMNTARESLRLILGRNKGSYIDSNLQFSRLKFGRVEEIVWKASDGHDVKGGLYYPVD